QASPTMTVTWPEPSHSGHGAPCTVPLPWHFVHVTFPVWEAPGSASSPGLLSLAVVMNTPYLTKPGGSKEHTDVTQQSTSRLNAYTLYSSDGSGERQKRKRGMQEGDGAPDTD